MLRKVAADYRQVNEVARALHLEMAAAYLVNGYAVRRLRKRWDTHWLLFYIRE